MISTLDLNDDKNIQRIGAKAIIRTIIMIIL